MLNEDVVITAAGLLTPMGIGIEENLKNLFLGEKPFLKVKDLPEERIGPVTMYVGKVPGFKVTNYVKNKKVFKYTPRLSQLGLAACRLALDMVGIDNKMENPSSVGLFCSGVGSGGEAVFFGGASDDVKDGFLRAWDEERNVLDSHKFGRDGLKYINPLFFLKSLPNNAFYHMSLLHDIKGDNNTIFASFMSGMISIGRSFVSLKESRAVKALAGGFDESTMAGQTFMFKNLGFSGISMHVPYKEVPSTVPSEGASLLMLEKESLCNKSNALARVLGYAHMMIPKHPFLPDKEGQGLVWSTNMAVKQAGVSLEDVDVVILDGIGEPHYDASELNAYRTLFGNLSKKPLATTFKPMVGLSGAASSAIDVALGALCLKEGKFPPVCGLTSWSDTEVPLIVGDTQNLDAKHIIVWSRGLFGLSGCMVLGRA